MLLLVQPFFMKAKFLKHTLQFKTPGGTSRGILKTKTSWFLILENDNQVGIGECSIIEGLNPEPTGVLDQTFQEIINKINNGVDADQIQLGNSPSVRFAIEMALLDLRSGGQRRLFDSDFVNHHAGIKINGLVWMGSRSYMQEQIKQKLDQGFDCIKLKVAAINFEEELDLIKSIRKEFDAKTIEIRVDANGGFTVKDALDKLKRLSDLDIHSIEQPIKPNQFEDMARLTEVSPLPIALDEEVIGLRNLENKLAIITQLQPQYVILKPSLVGGIKEANEWIEACEENGIGWWVTSALESNIGLNAIAQWTYTLHSKLPQGLGTGQLFTNNISSPLKIKDGALYHSDEAWDMQLFSN